VEDEEAAPAALCSVVESFGHGFQAGQTPCTANVAIEGGRLTVEIQLGCRKTVETFSKSVGLKSSIPRFRNVIRDSWIVVLCGSTVISDTHAPALDRGVLCADGTDW
jgi:hypothetical protein